jgi:hypothetical protein
MIKAHFPFRARSRHPAFRPGLLRTQASGVPFLFRIPGLRTGLFLHHLPGRSRMLRESLQRTLVQRLAEYRQFPYVRFKALARVFPRRFTHASCHRVRDAPRSRHVRTRCIFSIPPCATGSSHGRHHDPPGKGRMARQLETWRGHHRGRVPGRQRRRFRVPCHDRRAVKNVRWSALSACLGHHRGFAAYKDAANRASTRLSPPPSCI